MTPVLRMPSTSVISVVVLLGVFQWPIFFMYLANFKIVVLLMNFSGNLLHIFQQMTYCCDKTPFHLIQNGQVQSIKIYLSSLKLVHTKMVLT